MSVLVLHADVVDKGLKLSGVLLASTSVGSILGITTGVLERKPLEKIEMWGFVGTAIGCLVGFLLMLCAWIILDRS